MSKEDMEALRMRLSTLDISDQYRPRDEIKHVPEGPGREYLQWLEEHWK